ncbi:hypothetical protein [uncultured Desulfosarcina sp.]|uniref:hypothetical protein n=1 Tax=uncultured Desulfosarcina sp. TaxID=218289 RepID=UPI0029C72B47|nr:hypothetical protein [uncultured Desulfosarcina sp.]
MFGDFQYTTTRRDKPLQNALFLLIPASYVAGWTLDNSYNATLKKINDAQTQFSEAVEAIELLKSEYLEENERLGNLMNEVKTKKAEYEKTSNKLDLTKDMLQKDQEALKKVLGIDERRSKIAGFLSGVIASIVATAIWVYGPKIWKWIIALATNQV